MSTLRLFVVLAASCGRIDFDVLATADAALVDASGGSVVPGCRADETVLPWTTSFDEVPSWAFEYGTPQGRAIVDGGYEITPDIAQGTLEYWGIIDTTAVDHRERRMFIEVVRTGDTATSAQALFRFADTDVWSQMFQSRGHIYGETFDNSTLMSSMRPYDPVADRWWQIRESAGTVHFETSPDGLAWSELYARPTLPFMVTSHIELGAGYYELQTVPPGTARFDNLVVCGP